METFNPKEHFRATLMIFTVLLGSLFVYAMVALYLTYGKKEPEAGSDIFLAIALVLATASIMAGPAIAQKIVSRALKSSFEEKMNAYRSSTLVKLAFLEGAALFAITGYLLKANLFLLVIAAILVFLFRFNRPTPVRVAKTMQLKHEEAVQLT